MSNLREDIRFLYTLVLFLTGLFLVIGVLAGFISLGEEPQTTTTTTASAVVVSPPHLDPIEAYCRGASEGQAALVSVMQTDAGVENPTVAQADVDSMEAQCLEVLTTIGYNMPWRGPLQPSTLGSSQGAVIKK